MQATVDEVGGQVFCVRPLAGGVRENEGRIVFSKQLNKILA